MIFHANKSKLFECNISLKGAKLSETKARLIFECENGINVLCHGEINKDGICKVDVPPFKNLTETTGGNALLEVIAEDTMFVPWKDEFSVEIPKSVVAEIIDVDNKPKVSVSEVKEIKHQTKVEIVTNPMDDLKEIFKENKITKAVISKNKIQFAKIIMEYFNSVNLPNKRQKLKEFISDL